MAEPRRMEPQTLRRYLSQYPFLWAVEHAWSDMRTVIKVERADYETFSAPCLHGATLVFLRDSHGYPVLNQAQGYVPGTTLARICCDLIDEQAKWSESPVNLEYVIRRTWRADHSSIITIYRGPKGSGSLVDFLRKISKE
ncbi:MAG TPA: hypothetical protein VD998_03905 [Verrucomicrobiae bacterium]|nr:hypothetical protein [Verrucomicrobiae bacterium]